MKGLKRALLIIAVLAATAFLSWEALKIRDIVVVGTHDRLPAEVVAASGIGFGDSLLTINKEAAEMSIEADPYFKFEDIEIDWPNGIIIYVTERVPKTYIQYLNAVIIMDEAGFVLEIGSAVGERSLVRVSGLQVETYLIGQELTARNQGQVEVFGKVYKGFEKEGMIGELREISVSQSLTARAVMRQGLSVELGTADKLDEKVRLVDAIIDSLLQTYGQGGVDGASLDVSSGEFGDFSPARR